MSFYHNFSRQRGIIHTDTQQYVTDRWTDRETGNPVLLPQHCQHTSRLTWTLPSICTRYILYIQIFIATDTCTKQTTATNITAKHHWRIDRKDPLRNATCRRDEESKKRKETKMWYFMHVSRLPTLSDDHQIWHVGCGRWRNQPRLVSCKLNNWYIGFVLLRRENLPFCYT